jgi:hypothetical protein
VFLGKFEEFDQNLPRLGWYYPTSAAGVTVYVRRPNHLHTYATAILAEFRIVKLSSATALRAIGQQIVYCQIHLSVLPYLRLNLHIVLSHFTAFVKASSSPLTKHAYPVHAF